MKKIKDEIKLRLYCYICNMFYFQRLIKASYEVKYIFDCELKVPKPKNLRVDSKGLF